MVLVQGPLLSRLSNTVSDSLLMVGGSMILSAGFAFLLSGDMAMIYAAAVLIASLTAVVIGVIVLGPPLLEKIQGLNIF